MSTANDAPHTDANLSVLYLIFQEAQVASVKNTEPWIWWTSKTNDAPHKDAIQGLHLTYQEGPVSSVKNTKRRRW